MEADINSNLSRRNLVKQLSLKLLSSPFPAALIAFHIAFRQRLIFSHGKYVLISCDEIKYTVKVFISQSIKKKTTLIS